MNFTEQLITIAAVILGTMATRFLPFLLFPSAEKTPPQISFLGKVLPPAVMGMLVVFSLKNTSLLTGSRGLPELIACIITVLLQVYVKNVLLSIAAGTVSYMLLIQHIFI